ncbi:MAG TPA: methyltransferase domain-containing protein [Actinophytocola sp.]|uniref:methyltransferase domain-containing protein n=1 Tax=Actinophytocola sp. TaxID=1872138 RepID=UPI002E026567|nr:methyltransferase domain-containing protein [Actinophytocola sp.]
MHTNELLAELLPPRARALPEPDGTYDATLLLGPLYHLLDRDDRVRALSEAARVIRPGGLVLAAAISRFAGPLQFAAWGKLTGPWVERSRLLIAASALFRAVARMDRTSLVPANVTSGDRDGTQPRSTRQSHRLLERNDHKNSGEAD